MLCTIILYLLLLLLCSYIIIFQTSISISLLRMQMFRPFSQNTTLPSGVLANLSNPELYGLFNTSVLRIPSESGYLGAWYMQPGDSQVACPVTVLYLHGRSQNRGYSHRAGLYKVLLNMGFCVLAMDYRGFGDSSVVEIQEDTVLEDAVNAHRYLTKYYKPQKILIWGNSLGAPIAARFAAQDIGLRMAFSSTWSWSLLLITWSIWWRQEACQAGRSWEYRWWDLRELTWHSGQL